MNLQFVYEREYDVVVCGIGSAGFTAAVACARHGLRTAAVEAFHMPGGVLTMLGNACIHQFNNPYREPGDRMIIRGIGWEYVQRLAQKGDAQVADQDAPYTGNHSQYGVWVNPVGASYTMAEMLLEAGAALYFAHPIVDTVCTDTPTGRRVDGVVVSTKDGLALLRAKIVIDCTGDGDVAAFSGAAFEKGRPSDGFMQAMSLLMVFQSVQSVMSKGVLRGGGDTRFLMFADLIFMWGLNIPIGYLAGLRWGWSPFWVFVCLKLDTICKSFLCLWRLVQGRWIKNVNETT